MFGEQTFAQLSTGFTESRCEFQTLMGCWGQRHAETPTLCRSEMLDSDMKVPNVENPV